MRNCDLGRFLAIVKTTNMMRTEFFLDFMCWKDFIGNHYKNYITHLSLLILLHYSWKGYWISQCGSACRCAGWFTNTIQNFVYRFSFSVIISQWNTLCPHWFPNMRNMRFPICTSCVVTAFFEFRHEKHHQLHCSN